MKALVTGCAGFIGSNLTDFLLKCGYDVVGIDCYTDYYSKELKLRNISNALKHKCFEFIEKDILEMEKYPEADFVFHMAAQAGVRASWGENFQIYTKNNIEVTQRLLEFYKNQNLKKFIYSSSSSVYGNAELPMNEGSLLKPVSPYGVSKLAAEHLCYLYWKNFKVPTISLRYFTVYGPRQRPDMAIHKFVKSILSGAVIEVYGDGTQTRDFTYIYDIVKANVWSAESEIEGEVFNVGGGSRISVNDLIKAIEKFLGVEANVKYVGKQKGDVKDTGANLDKIESFLDWKPENDILSGLEMYIKWYLKVY